MTLAKHVTCLYLLAALSAICSADQDVYLGKRSPVLEGRQQCPYPGWIPACPVGIPCIPLGGICCSDGVTYVMPPDTCPDGTEPLATATIKPQAPKTTITPPPTTQTLISYTWFTTEYTWYYWYYYFTYIAVAQSSTITSSAVTTVTTVSVSATNSAQASALFNSLSATLAFPTPTQTTTSVYGSHPAVVSATSMAPLTTSPASAFSHAASSASPSSSAVAFTGAATATPGNVMFTWAIGTLALILTGLI